MNKEEGFGQNLPDVWSHVSGGPPVRLCEHTAAFRLRPCCHSTVSSLSFTASLVFLENLLQSFLNVCFSLSGFTCKNKP